MLEQLYFQYQNNLYNLIKIYQLNYEWLNIKETDFQTNSRLNFNNFNMKANVNECLKKYANYPIQLGEDIINNGMYVPFYFYKINNKKYLFLGRHRYYALKVYYLFNKNAPNKKFLFIELPYSQEKTPVLQRMFYYFDNYTSRSLYTVKYINDISNLLLITGDKLTVELWKNKINTFTPFNNEIAFTNWLNKGEN